ncbi:MAG: BCD family MFS transporter [Beijerinckiaceae bacterium]|nr:BCD family MFS transporter [Beijerinckiaceae bacterium]
MGAGLSWLAIVRIGLVQTALGAIVVLATSTLNRIMVIEIGLPAVVPGILIAAHYAVQILRPRWGHGSDAGGRRTPWIIGGMAMLALGGPLAALATVWMAHDLAAGLCLAVLAFALIGMGVGAAGTSLLVLLAERVGPSRRGASAAIVWMMMIAGFAVTAISAGHALEPYSPTRLVLIVTIVSGVALLVATIAISGIEGAPLGSNLEQKPAKAPFMVALREVWSEPQARTFTLFIFVSMLAYNAQELLLEPYAGAIFGMSPGQSTKLGGLHHAGILLGMVLVAVIGTRRGPMAERLLRLFMTGGCVASALCMLLVAAGGFVGPDWPLKPAVFALGVSNGVFTIAAIGSMMSLAGTGHAARQGVRMGVWGAAQAIAFALGGLAGTIAVDIAKALLANPILAYASVFTIEAAAFLVAAVLAVAVTRGKHDTASIIDKTPHRSSRPLPLSPSLARD